MISNKVQQEKATFGSLRLYAPADSPATDTTEPSRWWSLSQVFERAFTPLWLRPLGLSSKTEQLYREALAHWSEITGDPPVGEITDYTTAKFSATLLEKPGRKGPTMAVGTVRKHCSRIDKLLAFCGPRQRSRSGRRNLGLLELPPLCDSPHADYEAPAGDFTLEEVSAILEACSHAQPTDNVAEIAAPDFWRALVVVAFYTGLRIGELMALEYQDLSGSTITVWARSAKGRKGKRQYLHAEALAALESIRTARSRVFPWQGWPSSARWLRTLFSRILERAGLPPHRRFGFHALRKAHATVIADQDQAGGVAAAQASLGHSSSSVTTSHYVAGRVQAKLVASAIDRLPTLVGK